MNKNKKKMTKEYQKRHKFGQFFTSNDLVCLISETFGINYNDKTILEPSFGGCAFIKYIVENSINSDVTAVDIDSTLCRKYKKEYQNINFKCSDFLAFKTKQKFDIVIGNPPFNLKTTFDYYDTTEGFVLKSLEMLKPGGSLFFVMPSTILRNKQYQNLREIIISNYKILGIINTTNYEFLGADIETIVIGIKNEKTDMQSYFYLNNGQKSFIDLSYNKRMTINIENASFYNILKCKSFDGTIGEYFKIYRGHSKIEDSIKGRDVNFYGYFLSKSNCNNYFLGLQNIAYRLVSNVVQSEFNMVSDTVTILESENLTTKRKIFISEYLNSSIANYFLHVGALNNCKLTIHIDKYYIEDIPIPQYNDNFDDYLLMIDAISNTSEIAKIRNRYFYDLLSLKKSEILEIEKIWKLPNFKEKNKFVIGEVV